MKSDDIMQSMNYIDENLVSNAEKLRSQKPKKRSKMWIRIVAAAACVSLVITGIALIPGNKPTAYAIAEASYPKQAEFPSNIEDQDKYNIYSEAEHTKRQLAAKHIGEGMDFYKNTAAEIMGSGSENKVYSPLNAYFALSILAETASGESRDQILKLLGADSMEALRKSANDLWQAEYKDDSTGKCLLANSLWLNDSVDFNKSTLDTVAKNYYASSYSGNMTDSGFNKQRQTWVNDQTDGLLKEAVENLKFSPETVMSLISTINFRAKWQDEFDEADTYEEVFHSVGGDSKCDFMHRENDLTVYYWGKNFSAVPMNLTENGTMWLILPDKGTAPEELVSNEDVMSMISDSDYKNFSSSRVDLSIPKFDISSDIDLGEKLQKLGVTDIFDFNKADFSSLTGKKGDVALSSAEHAARVTIDEKGVTAAAFTNLDYAGAGMPEGKVDFKLDRPFMFIITGKGSMPLFVGIVNAV